MDEEEELEELEDKLDELKRKVEEIESQVTTNTEATEERPYQQIVSSDRPFVLHWVSGQFGGVDSVAKAKWAFANAIKDKKNSSKPVQHGDMMILDTDCPWYGLLVEQGEIYQSVGYEGEDPIGIVVWNGCSELTDCACDDTIEELISGGIDESSPDTSWKVSLGTCVWFNQLMSVSIYSHTSAGTVLLTKTRAFTLNKCGAVVDVGREVEDSLLIPCECGEDPPTGNYDDCSEFATMPNSITLEETDSQGTVTTTTLYKYTISSTFCRFTTDSTGGSAGGGVNDYSVRFLSGLWKVYKTGTAYATHHLFFGNYTTINGTSTWKVL